VKIHNRAELLPINLDSQLPFHGPLLALAQVQLFPVLPANIILNADPQGQVWLITAHLVNEKGRAVRGEIDFSSSGGQLSNPRCLEPGVSEIEWRPDAKGWKRVLISAVEQMHHIGAVLEILEP